MTTLFAGMTVGTIIALVVVGVIFYFIPSVVAWKRKHRQLIPIILLNVFLGWSFLGWVGALVWAFLDDKKNASPAHHAQVGTTGGGAVNETPHHSVDGSV